MIDNKALRDIYNKLKYFKLVSNQADFGEKLGYTRSHFNQIMNGAQPITEKLVRKIQSVFGKGYTQPEVIDNRDIGTAYGRDQLEDMLNQLEESNVPYDAQLKRIEVLRFTYDQWFKAPPIPQDELNLYYALANTHSQPELIANIMSRIQRVEDKIG